MDKNENNAVHGDIDISELLSGENPEILIEQTKPFAELMMQYRCAIKEVRTKFEVLSEEFSARYDRNPVEAISSRLKSPMSIVDKLRRKKLPISVDSMREHINDIAGVRIICAYPKDIYTLADVFLKQDDVKLIKVKDYIKEPKPNGYRSLHLIIEIPIFLTQGTEHMRVEVQLRTLAMNFWASLEHQSKYKKSIKNEKIIGAELKACAEIIARLDNKMQAIHMQIEDAD